MNIKRDLLRTKFYIPPGRPEVVARPRLLRRLEEGLGDAPVVIVSAPAGYGKTTLIASWLRRRRADSPEREYRVAWVSIDDQDDEPAGFFAYVVAAIQAAGIDWPLQGRPLWDDSDPQSVEALIAALLNEFDRAESQRPLILVLDDYHKIRSPVVHEALQFLIDHAPPTLHVVLTTREDPPLTLARWRARGRMIEIRAADLRFSAEEAADYLNGAMGLALSAAQVEALEERTEGWIAGLHLAALALKSPDREGRNSGEDLIASFSGSHHYVIDYLMEEVLRQQDGAVGDFLRQTSVLDRLCAPLCDAVTGRDDSRDILKRLERTNLFLVPLDDRREWYRYHHLMADSLRAGLDQSARETAHRRASQWYEARGVPAGAFHHARATGDLEWAADVLERVIQDAAAWSRGEMSQLTGWLDSLPDAALAERPTLALHASRALYLSGRMERAESLLRQADHSLRRDAEQGRPQAELTTLATILRAATDAMRGERLNEAIAAMEKILARPAAVSPHAVARAADTLGLARELTGDVAGAEEAYRRASELAGAAGVRYLAVNARCEAALMQIQQGRLTLAAETCRLALALAGDDDIPPMGLAWAVLGEIARERNDLKTAERLITTGIATAHKGGIVDDLRYAYLFLARLRLAQGDPAAALAAWHQADALIRPYHIPRLDSLSAAHRARIELSAGNLALVAKWAEAYRRERDARPVEYRREFEDLTLAGALLAAQQHAAALALLRPLSAEARASGRIRTAIQADILTALALPSRAQEASDALVAALASAAPEGFGRLFIDEGPSLLPLLAQARPAAPEFAGRLLAALSPDGRSDQPPPTPPTSPNPLSDREMDVLRLLNAGLSNREIADELTITVGTAKWHVHNIYEKLDARGRVQAIARARELNLL